MRTIIFFICGLFCFFGITYLRAIDQLPLVWYIVLCLGGMALVAFVCWLKIEPAVEEATREIEDN